MFILSDAELKKSVISISYWIKIHKRQGGAKPDMPNSCEKVTIDDLAVAVPGECLFPELGVENEEASREKEKGILVYSDINSCHEASYIWLKGKWHLLEKVLNTSSPKVGWVKVSSIGEQLLVLLLTQLDYLASEKETEVPYSCCPLSDVTYLLWHENRPVGMCSLKTRGSSLWGGPEVYMCDTLDTLYIRQCARRRGFAIDLLQQLISQLQPGEHLGLSYPLSSGMCRVLFKFVRLYPTMCEAMWTLDEDGEVSGTVALTVGTRMLQTQKAQEVPMPCKMQDDLSESMAQVFLAKHN